MHCLDCGKRTGTIPVVLTIDSKVLMVCRKCWDKDWQNALHPLICECSHCHDGRLKASKQLSLETFNHEVLGTCRTRSE